jgi:hypothetical protein
MRAFTAGVCRSANVTRSRSAEAVTAASSPSTMATWIAPISVLIRTTLISLTSELCFAAGGCGPAADPSDPGPGNRMYAWLAQDLADHPDSDYPCTLAYWHHPRFSFSTGSGGRARWARSGGCCTRRAPTSC